MDFRTNQNRVTKKRDDFLDDAETKDDYLDNAQSDYLDNTQDDPYKDDLGFAEDIDSGFGFDNYDMGNTPPMDKYPNLLKGMTEFSGYLRTLYNDWVGLTWNESDKKFTRDVSLEPIMNVKGANWSISFIKTFVRKTNLIAYLEKKEYDYILDNLNTVLYLSLIRRYHDFGFRVYADLLRVWNEIETASLMAISVAGGGKMHEFLAGKTGGLMSYKGGDIPIGSQQGMMMSQKQKKKGILGWLGFGGS